MHTEAKSRMQKAPGDEETSLVFISFKDPTQAKSSVFRKAVRSHITRRQHRQNREHKARIASSQSTEASKPESSTTTATTVAGDIARTPSPRPVLAPPRLDMTFIPAELRGFVLGSLEYYETVIAVENDFICGPGRKNALRTEWPFFMMSDRVSLLSMALNVSPFYAKEARGVPCHDRLIEVLYLRGLVVRGINQALSTSAPISDQLMFAVLAMAHFEYLSGKENACSLHLQAFYKMVCLRGGLKTLGLDGLLERAAIFMDFHLAFVTNREPYFDSYAHPSSQLRPRLDLKAFFGQDQKMS